MLLLAILFWVLIGLHVLSIFVYPIILSIKFALHKTNRNQEIKAQTLPSITIVIPAYNEELVIRKKIENTLNLHYPKQLLQILIVADGSTDNTVNIIKEFENVEVLFYSQRLGKSAAINHAMEFSKNPITVFTDADTTLNSDALNKIVQHYTNEKVGAVCCEKKIASASNNNLVSSMEGMYWSYESWVKKVESDTYSVIGAAGELFSIRTNLFKPIPKNAILDDFTISSNILKQNYKVSYETASVAIEPPTISLKQEAKRKIRLGAGAAQTLILLKLFPYKKPWLNIQFFLRRTVRWAIAPLSIFILLLINLVFLENGYSVEMYSVIFYFQLIFYILAAIGLICYFLKLKSSIALIPFYYLFMNCCMLLGFLHYAVFSKQWVWDKAKKEVL